MQHTVIHIYSILKTFLWLCLGNHSTWLQLGKDGGIGLLLKKSEVTEVKAQDMI